MNFPSWLVWGLSATIAESTISAVVQGLGLTRMNIPYMLGTIFTANRDRAKLFGFLFHLADGWAFSLFYVFIFQALGSAGWWRGAIIGLIHALFVLTVVVRLLPGLHPRMAGEQHGPSAQNMLEPPGFLALHYGVQTPLTVVLSHVVFGILLGVFYQVK